MQKDECTRIEWLSQFDDYALASMANEGYRLEDDTLETCTLEELKAVEAHREASWQKWLETNAHVELESFTEGEGNLVTEVLMRVYGGSDHNARVSAATDYLEFMTDSGYRISTENFQCAAKQDDSGNSYVEFHYGNFSN